MIRVIVENRGVS